MIDANNFDKTAFEQLGIGERYVLEWQYPELFGAAGSFRQFLMKAMAKADEHNLLRLAAGFPEQADAMRAFKNIPGWWPQLEKRIFPTSRES